MFQHICVPSVIRKDWKKGKSPVHWEKRFDWIKANYLFDSNNVYLNQIKVCLNQINFLLKTNKLYLWPYINALISLFRRKIYLIWKNIYWVQRYFVWIIQILFHSDKSFVWIQKSFLNKLFSFVQSNIFSQCKPSVLVINPFLLNITKPLESNCFVLPPISIIVRVKMIFATKMSLRLHQK